MTTTNSFLGIPVEGDINEGSKRPNQRPIEDLAPLMQAVLDDPTIKEFGWTQYTPYFNDGDPCVFGVRGEVWVRTVEDGDDGKCGDCKEGKCHGTDPDECGCDRHAASVEDEDYDEDDTYEFEVGDYGVHPTLGGRRREWSEATRKYEDFGYEGPDEARHARCVALAKAINGGAFLDVLLNAFGDHATVTVRKTGIKVGEYSHD